MGIQQIGLGVGVLSRNGTRALTYSSGVVGFRLGCEGCRKG